MTTLTELKNELKAFGKQRYGYMKQYIELAEDLGQKLKQGVMYQSEVEARLHDFKQNVETQSRQKADELYNKIEQTYEAELVKLQDTVQGVTADDVAELTLLATTEVTKDELEEYFVKYKNKPLAVKKLKEIAKQSPELMVDVEQFDKEQSLYNLRQFFKQQLSSFMGYYTVTDDKIRLVQADMIINGDVTALDDYLARYLANQMKGV
ncbi:hypothetical protein ACQRD4_00940 [Streptococcus hyointestinalis]|uniref:hypothetical protein n=1 Tax=Streptococcus hyointestinalis TaxID=1337 RepID=UPI003D093605